MSERMADERIRSLMDPEGAAWSDYDANEIAAEAVRARRVEQEQAELIETLKFSHDLLEKQRNEQAETIKVLVDALGHVRKAGVNKRTWNEDTGKFDNMQMVVLRALRHAGRLP